MVLSSPSAPMQEKQESVWGRERKRKPGAKGGSNAGPKWLKGMGLDTQTTGELESERALSPTPNRDLPFGSQSLLEVCSYVPQLPSFSHLYSLAYICPLEAKPRDYSLSIPNSLCSKCWKGKAEGRMSLVHFMHVDLFPLNLF